MNATQNAYDFCAMPESIAAAEAHIAASAAVLAQMTQALGQRTPEMLQLPVREMSDFEVTRGAAIQPQRHTDPNAPRGLLRLATDGERHGRLSWLPGA